MAETYTLNVAGLTRELTICKVNDHMARRRDAVFSISEKHPLVIEDHYIWLFVVFFRNHFI